METALTWLYTLSGVAAATFYLPQIRVLIAGAEARRTMSLATWGGWLGVGAVTVLYAALVIEDDAMLVVGGLNCAGQAVVLGLAVAQRLRDRNNGGMDDHRGRDQHPAARG